MVRMVAGIQVVVALLVLVGCLVGMIYLTVEPQSVHWSRLFAVFLGLIALAALLYVVLACVPLLKLREPNVYTCVAALVSEVALLAFTVWVIREYRLHVGPGVISSEVPPAALLMWLSVLCCSVAIVLLVLSLVRRDASDPQR